MTTCRKPVPTALTLLLGSQPKNIDVLLIEAENAATCGFDFRGIVEPHLSIPVIYYCKHTSLQEEQFIDRSTNIFAAVPWMRLFLMLLDHENTGDRVNMIRSKLGAGTYTIRRPLNVADVWDLWRVILWRKCCLVGINPSLLMAGGNPGPDPDPSAVVGGSDGRGLNRKNSDDPGSSSSSGSDVAG